MKAKILVVEDNPLNMQMVRDILQYRGHRVLEATTVEEGRERLSANLPDLVLVDIQIPGGGGERLLRDIRADGRLRHIPVIAVTAFAMEGDQERFLKAGFTAYISKPIDTRQFGPTVESFLPQDGKTDA